MARPITSGARLPPRGERHTARRSAVIGEVSRACNERFLLIRRAAARDLIERGKRSGEIAKGVDVELAIDLIYGPLYHRLLARHQPLDKRFATDLVNWALRGLSPR